MRALILPLCLLAALASGAASQPSPSPLAATLAAALDEFPATTGILVRHLATGEEAGVRADEAFSPASVIKLAFMARAYELADRGELDLDARTTIERAHLRHGTGLLAALDPGVSPTLRDLITLMIVVSDNTATDLVITRIGGVDTANEWLAARGFADIRSHGRPHDYRRDLLTLIDPAFGALTAEETTGLLFAMDGNPLFARYTGVFEGPKARWVEMMRDPDVRRRFAEAREDRTSRDPAFWLGRMTPRATVRLLEAIERGTGFTAASAAEMRLALRRQQLGARRLPHFLTVPVGHKTGDGGRIANDAGLIYARSGPIAVAMFATAIRGSYGEAEDRIGRLAVRIVEHFDRSR